MSTRSLAVTFPVTLPATLREGLEILPVEHVDQVLARALAEPVTAIEWSDDDEHAPEPPAHGTGTAGEPAVRH